MTQEGQAAASVVGTEGKTLQEAQQALEAERTLNEAKDRLAATQAAARGAEGIAQLPSEAEKIQSASLLREAQEAANINRGAQAATGLKTLGMDVTGAAQVPSPGGLDTLLGGATTTGAGMGLPSAMTMEGVDTTATPTEIAAKTEEAPDISDVKKDAKTGGMDWNDLMIKMGLGLMAGKSPNALTNVGEAGLGTLQMQMAEKKMAMEQAKAEAERELYQQHGKYFGQQAAMLERGGKEKNIAGQALVAATQMFNALYKGDIAMQMDETAKNAEMDRLYKYALGQLQASQGPNTMGAGDFKVLGVRPSS